MEVLTVGGTEAGERKRVCTYLGGFTPEGCISDFLRVNVYNWTP